MGRATRVINVAVALVIFLLVVWLGSHFGWFAPANRPQIVVLYCFSALDDVMRDRLLPAFQENWQREQGQTVELVATFAGSGDITDRILAEYPADIAIVSSELDAYRLPAPWRSWQALPHGGVLARSPLVIVVREGNPEPIRGFEDQGSAGIDLLHADPQTSGLAELAILAQYGSALRRSGEADAAYRQLLAIWRNVVARPPTAREMRRRFEDGLGDAFVTYEADAIGSPSRGRIRGDIVYPPATMVAEPVVVRIEKNILERERRVIDAFIEFLWTRPAQEALVEYGFRSVEEELNRSRADLPNLAPPLTLDDLGGLNSRRAVLEGVWEKRVAPELER